MYDLKYTGISAKPEKLKIIKITAVTILQTEYGISDVFLGDEILGVKFASSVFSAFWEVTLILSNSDVT